MGCGSSREVSQAPAGSEHASPAPRETRLATSHVATSQTPLSQGSNRIDSPSTSRPALNPISSTSLPSGSARSSPRRSSHRPRHTAPADNSTTSNLSEHYNVPLQYPKAWRSQSKTWTPSQLRRERQDFFDTRVTGHTEVWEALRQVAECIRERELPTAQGILDAVNVTLPTGQLEEGCYDERGFLYRIPEEVLTNPANMQQDPSEVDGETVVGVPTYAGSKMSSDTLDKQATSIPRTIMEKPEMTTVDKDKSSIPADAIPLKCRMSDRGSDIAAHVGRTEAMGQLAARLKEVAQIPKYARIEFFYLGKKLDHKKTLEEQDYLEGHVLNVFVVGAAK